MSVNVEHDPFTALNLPQAVHAQALKLLERIRQAHRNNDWRRHSGRSAASQPDAGGLGRRREAQ